MTSPRSDTHGRIAASDIAALLAECAESLCRELLPAGHRAGAEWIEAARKDGGLGDSLRVHLTGAKAGVWSHFASSHGGDALDLVAYLACGGNKGRAFTWAKRWLGIDGDRPSTPSRQAGPSASRERAANEDAKRRQDYALRIWREAQPASGTLVETYFHHRGLTGDIPPTLRYGRGLEYEYSGLTLSAQVAAVQAPDRRVIAVHRTFLRLDGRGKAAVKKPKMALGSLGNGAVRLGHAGPALGIAEGIETALSASQIFDIPVWAALSVGRLQSVWLPPDVTEIQIFGDNGERGHEGAEKARQAFNEQGRRVVLRFPPEPFGDWNDFLQGQKTEAIA